jgi:predicted nucleic acid-binding protein
MNNREYLLDSNIVIKLWRKYPHLLDKIEDTAGMDYKVAKNIAGELSVKEYREFNGMPILTDKFLKLIDHIIEIDKSIYEQGFESISSFKHDTNKNIYYIDDNKLSANDFSLIATCKKYEQYILVTEDKKIYNSARVLLGASRVLNFKDFLTEINKKII